ncbi:MAG: hypothetical protein AAFZ15_17815 [Bacteroidota bacterium]
MLKKSAWLTFLFLLATLIASAQQSPCTQDAGFRQLDFWVGHWRVETPDGQLAGHNKIEIILDSCIVFENWTGAGVSRGKSFNYYNAKTNKWHQHWVDNFGNSLKFEGEATDGEIVYTGTSFSSDGKMVFDVLTLTKVNDDEVRQIWRQSKAGGEWKIVFDGRYLREK